jgi:hypothetical protein
MAETDANEEARAGEQERPHEDEEELKAEQDSAEAMDADVPHPPGFEEEGRRD